MDSVVNVLNFHDKKKYGNDMTPAVILAIERCRAVENPLLLFPEGTYHFWPDSAFEKFYYVSNNDYGLKKIAFPLIGFENICIEGSGSEFIFHGRISPFIIDSSSDITVRNLSIDYDRPFFSQGLVLNADNTHVDLMIEKTEFPYRVENERIIFYGGNWESEEDNIMGLTEFDPETKAPAYKMVFYIAKFPQNKMQFNDETMDSLLKEVTATELSEGIIRLTGNFDRVFRSGNIITIGHENRNNSGIFINKSSNINLESINIYHVGAMGVIAQLSEDITVKGLNVKLREGTGRIVSTNADATHFVNCTGTITMEECVFENMLDDAANIHGICTTVSEIMADNTVEVELMHFQQRGINIFAPGDRINFVNRETLLPIYTAKVADSLLVDPAHIKLVFEEDISSKVEKGDAIDNISRMPDVIIKKCRTGNNRPRGFLVSTPGKVIIEENVFYNSHCAISILGDANYWFESGAVNDVVMRNNEFKDCCYASGGHVIVIWPEIKQLNENLECYHKNIVIENNRFDTFDIGLLCACSVDGLKFTGNRYHQSQTFRSMGNVSNHIDLKACKNTFIYET